MSCNPHSADSFGSMSLPVSDCLRWALLLLLLIGIPATRGGSASAQANESATKGRASICAGVAGSGYYLSYGKSKLIGMSGFVDADSGTRIGIELEGRWLEYHSSDDVHAETFMIGPRYHFRIGRLEPYAKFLIGSGRLGFPYGYATGRDFVVSPGGGADFRLNQRVSLRVDMEFQQWAQFDFGSIESAGLSAGVRYRIF